jgi:hypothetical protein
MTRPFKSPGAPIPVCAATREMLFLPFLRPWELNEVALKTAKNECPEYDG